MFLLFVSVYAQAHFWGKKLLACEKKSLKSWRRKIPATYMSFQALGIADNMPIIYYCYYLLPKNGLSEEWRSGGGGQLLNASNIKTEYPGICRHVDL